MLVELTSKVRAKLTNELRVTVSSSRTDIRPSIIYILPVWGARGSEVG
jgi:hypothetical protein